MSSSPITRKPKWHPTPPPPPSPNILHFPRRTHRRNPKNTKKKQLYPLELHEKYYYKGRLDSLFDQERDQFQYGRTSSVINPIVLLKTSATTSSSASTAAQRRERVEEQEQEGGAGAGAAGGGGLATQEGAGARLEEKWRFQAEMLRAECNFLRTDREFALKKLEKNRLQMEKTLRLAVQTLISGKKKIFEGKNVNAVLEQEIEDLAEKLEELKKSCKNKDFEVRHCSNFDKKAYHLQKRLEKLGGLTDGTALKELQQLTQLTNEIDKESKNTSTDVELLREKIEGLSKGMLDGMEEEYGAIHSSTADSSIASSASTSKRIDSYTDPSSTFSTRQQSSQDMMPLEENKCSGRCKAIVRRIVEQVRAETEQWSQMQEMLQQVRGEMEELQASRDFWENRAVDFAHEIRSLQSTVEEWKDKAQAFETKAKDMKCELTAAEDELEKSRTKKAMAHDQREVTSTPNSPLMSLAKQIEKEKRVLVCRLKEEKNANQKLQKQRAVEVISTKDLPPISLGKQLEKEKHMLMHRLKENRRANDRSCRRELSPVGRRKEHPFSKESGVLKRPPFKDLGNSSPLLVRQNSKAVYPLHSPESRQANDWF
ncbi:myosin-3 [Capsicum chacoense]